MNVDQILAAGPATQRHVITCNYTGIVVASIELVRIAGHVPYLSQWKHTQALHPLFSLELFPLLQFSRSTWNYYCSLTPEQASDTALTNKQERLLQVAALAMLHQLGEVEQTTQWLPSIADVSGCWSSLIQLGYWKNYLESKRFRFPALRISKNNRGIDMHSYLQDCWEVKKEYETKVREAAELEKLQATERALVALRDDLVKKSPKSKKLLWRWFSAHIPAKYSRDVEGWMWDLYDAETSDEIAEFTLADIDLFEEIVLAEIPLGSSISHAFLERLDYKRKVLQARVDTYEILVPDSIKAGVADGSISTVEPQPEDYPSKVAFMVAKAKWRLATSTTNENEQKRQATVTVNASHVPELPQYEDEPQDLSDLFSNTKKVRRDE